jgi:hypothetical protein
MGIALTHGERRSEKKNMYMNKKLLNATGYGEVRCKMK